MSGDGHSWRGLLDPANQEIWLAEQLRAAVLGLDALVRILLNRYVTLTDS